MLCHVCVNVLEHRHGEFRDPQTHRTRFKHQPDLINLERSAKSSCQICSKAWRLLNTAICKSSARGISSEKSGIEDSPITYVELNYRELPRNYLVKIVPNFALFELFGTSLGLKYLGHFRLVPCDEESLAEYSGNVEVSERSTSSEGAFSQAEHWMDECVSKHTRCNQARLNPPWYPTRLLYVGGESEDNTALKLIDTAKETPTGSYITLSHCWGSASFIQSTRHNIESFRNKIHFLDLPKTFQDTIVVARRLKISYLWIDSLCILQDKDDRSDWHRESAQMDKVYAQAYCNISAAVATDASEGLFFPRDPESLRDSMTTIRHKEYYQEEDYDLPCAVLNEDIWKDLDLSHINTRGWVLQERLLAPRVLHFGLHELYFECRESQSSESHPDGTSSRKWFHAPMFKAFDAEPENKTDDPTDKSRDMSLRKYSTWSTIVHKYSAMALTNPNDKLPALSGIAKVMKERMQEDYVVGMWRKKLHEQLLWCMHFDNDTQQRQIGTRPPQYRAPSWSWAAIDGPVMFVAGHEVNLVPDGIIDVQIQQESEDATGAVIGGHIDIAGRLRSCRLVENSIAQGRRGVLKWSIEVNGIDLAKGVEVPLAMTEALSYHSELWNVIPDTAFDDADSSGNREFYYLPLWRESTRVCHALLLQLEDEAAGIYSRVGVVIAVGPKHVSVLHNESDDDNGTFPCKSYEDGVYTIRII